MAHRPRRGAAGPEIEIGDPYGQYEYQGGAAPGASESGDPMSREYGVPQADIPGGLNHLVNTQAHPAKPPGRPQEQPVINDHGVPPVDGTQYEFPGKADKQGHQPKPAPEPHISDAVPVYVVDKPGPVRNPIRKLITEGPKTLTGPTVDPIPLADRDPKRVKFWICNETTETGVGQAGPLFRIGDWETVTDGRGLAIPANTIKDFVTQDRVFAVIATGVTVTFSYGYETEIEGTG